MGLKDTSLPRKTEYCTSQCYKLVTRIKNFTAGIEAERASSYGYIISHSTDLKYL